MAYDLVKDDIEGFSSRSMWKLLPKSSEGGHCCAKESRIDVAEAADSPEASLARSLPLFDPMTRPSKAPSSDVRAWPALGDLGDFGDKGVLSLGGMVS